MQWLFRNWRQNWDPMSSIPAEEITGCLFLSARPLSRASSSRGYRCIWQHHWSLSSSSQPILDYCSRPRRPFKAEQPDHSENTKETRPSISWRKGILSTYNGDEMSGSIFISLNASELIAFGLLFSGTICWWHPILWPPWTQIRIRHGTREFQNVLGAAAQKIFSHVCLGLTKQPKQESQLLKPDHSSSYDCELGFCIRN